MPEGAITHPRRFIMKAMASAKMADAANKIEARKQAYEEEHRQNIERDKLPRTK